MERTIQEVARAAGTSSRTLRHYGSIGILPPSRIGPNGYRYYDERALVRLQRILLLRSLGLGLPEIGRVLDAQDARRAEGEAAEAAEARILTEHLQLLRDERARIDTQIGSLERTIAVLTRTARPETGANDNAEEELMTDSMFDGFNHAEHREEVARRWGADAARRGDDWWNGMNEAGQNDWKARSASLARAWTEAADAGADPAGDRAQALAEEHVAWLRSIPGTPAAGGGDLAGYLLGLGEMYVADERFAANYGGVTGATFVRDALAAYVARELS